MAIGPYNRFASSTGAYDRALFDEGLRQHMLRVFNYMTVGLIVTGLVAYFGAQSDALVTAIFGTPLKWVVMLAPIGFVLVLSAGFNRMSSGALRTLFFVFSGVMGLSLMSLFRVFTDASIARVFFISAATFAGAALYGYTAKRDLTQFGSFLIMGVIGLVIASLVNIFLASSALLFAVSVLGVLIFTGLTAYDSQRIKEMYAESWGVEANTKLAVMGALSLYMDFINIFISLMQLMGDRRN
ncbi:Bax inhibitor-1/YccA family protein [Nitrospirillum sp. BR 11752]|uniref:Bax inhibitor-1/YccA family protein n=1 Tax=Nitrospirillum sp. BR 11752 TaxID=3104293 RepID=UPI002EB1FD81|nr:Bax inhibitor-1/YccA family protein [Nitrospirillum sp. BR 11752]